MLAMLDLVKKPRVKMKVCAVGEAVGKTSLIHRFVADVFPPFPLLGGIS